MRLGGRFGRSPFLPQLQTCSRDAVTDARCQQVPSSGLIIAFLAPLTSGGQSSRCPRVSQGSGALVQPAMETAVKIKTVGRVLGTGLLGILATTQTVGAKAHAYTGPRKPNVERKAPPKHHSAHVNAPSRKHTPNQ
jgi:hypothetical protein